MKIADLVEETVNQLATVVERPSYVEVPSDNQPQQRRYSGADPLAFASATRMRAPAYCWMACPRAGLAAKAGLKAGDRIVAILGKPCNNMQTYMTLMGGVQAGDTVEFTIERDGKKQTVKIQTEK